MNLIKCMQTNSANYKRGYSGQPVGILWHDTAAGNPYILRYVQPSPDDPDYDSLMKLIGTNRYKNSWNQKEVSKGVNAFIGLLDDDKTVATAQCLPWEMCPWGVASGKNGSANGDESGRHWIQFEICDDGYKSKDYFEKVYKEAVEFTAHLCKLYGIDPMAKIAFGKTTAPTIMCHKDSYEYGLGSNHSDVRTWFNKFGKTMDDVRRDVAEILKADKKEPEIPEKEPQAPIYPETLTDGYYRVRKSWSDAKTQIGAYKNLSNAKNTADLHAGYFVFDPSGKAIYPEQEEVKPLAIGDTVKLTADAKWWSGASIPSWVFAKTLYVREIKNAPKVAISTNLNGAITGRLDEKYLVR